MAGVASVDPVVVDPCLFDIVLRCVEVELDVDVV